MKITNISAECPKPLALIIGRQLENNYRQFVFDCSNFGVEVSSITLVHQRKGDVAPYLVETSNTDSLTWTVSSTDTAYAGYGKAELRIEFTNGLAKSAVYLTSVLESITAGTVIPTPLQSWYDAMIDYIDENSISPEELGQAIEDYLDEHPVQVPVDSVNGQTGDVVITASDLGALTSESDPVFTASAAYGITSGDISNWNGKYTKPSGGVPVSDLNSTAQSRLMKTGGTTGQVLAKASNSNYDVEWVNQSGGGGAVDSVNGQTGTVVLTASDVGALASSTSYVSSFNGSSGAITYSAPVSSVNTKTGAVSLTASDVGALPDTYTAPVTSVNGQTGAVTVTDTNTTYTISIASNVITLTGSDSSTSSVTLPVYNGGIG